MVYIKEIIKEKGMTVEQLAKELGISRQALSRQLKGKLLVETAERIANTLGVPLWRLFVSNDNSPMVERHACPHCGKPISITLSKADENG